MSNVHLTNEYKKESLSFSSVLVGTVFFLVLSQALILRVPEIVTQIFRPIIVLFLSVKMMQRGQIKFGAGRVAVIAAIYCAFDLLLTCINADEIMRASAVALYLLMFWAVCGTPWNKREARTIIMACFLGTLACAVVLFISNDPTDLHVGSSGNMKMLGKYVNRNKNAYAFSTGTVLGVIYMIYGKNIKKFWMLLSTAVIAYALLYSQCRGAFLCAVAGVTIVVAGKLKEVKKQDEGKFILNLVLYIAFCVAMYFILKNSELSRLINGESKSGRDEGIKYAWNLYLDYDIFGKIFGRGYYYESAHTEGIGAHFVYTTYLLATGIIGCALIAFVFICSGLRIKGAVPYALWVCAFLRTFVEGLDYYIYIPLILSVVIYNYTLIHRRNFSELFSR